MWCTSRTNSRNGLDRRVAQRVRETRLSVSSKITFGMIGSSTWYAISRAIRISGSLVDLPRLPRWSRGRVVILGDAAHAPLPHQGQGAGQAIEDAYTIGSLLADRSLDDYRSTFESFERQRRRRTSRVQAYSRLAGGSYKLVGDGATRRDTDWPSLPQRIGWINSHCEEQAVFPPLIA